MIYENAFVSFSSVKTIRNLSETNVMHISTPKIKQSEFYCVFADYFYLKK